MNDVRQPAAAHEPAQHQQAEQEEAESRS